MEYGMETETPSLGVGVETELVCPKAAGESAATHANTHSMMMCERLRTDIFLSSWTQERSSVRKLPSAGSANTCILIRLPTSPMQTIHDATAHNRV